VRQVYANRKSMPFDIRLRRTPSCRYKSSRPRSETGRRLQLRDRPRQWIDARRIRTTDAGTRLPRRKRLHVIKSILKGRASRIVNRITVIVARKIHVLRSDHIHAMHIQYDTCRSTAAHLALHAQTCLLHPRRLEIRRNRRDLSGRIRLQPSRIVHATGPATVHRRIRIGRKHWFW